MGICTSEISRNNIAPLHKNDSETLWGPSSGSNQFRTVTYRDSVRWIVTSELEATFREHVCRNIPSLELCVHPLHILDKKRLLRCRFYLCYWEEGGCLGGSWGNRNLMALMCPARQNIFIVNQYSVVLTSSG